MKERKWYKVSFYTDFPPPTKEEFLGIGQNRWLKKMLESPHLEDDFRIEEANEEKT